MAAPDPVKQREEALLWLGRAERDLAAARLAMDAPEPLPDIAAYHLQQAAEKLLKAILTTDAIPFRRTHDLGLLGEQVSGARPALHGVISPLRSYSDWSFAFRYPGAPSEAYPEPLPAELAQALAEVTALRDVVADLLAADR